MRVKIISDSTCDLSPALLERYDIAVTPLCVIKDGKDCVIFTCGIMLEHCLEAVQLLAEQGIDAALVSFHTRHLCQPNQAGRRRGHPL